MSEIWDIPPPTNRGSKPPFSVDFATQRQRRRLMFLERNTVYKSGQVRCKLQEVWAYPTSISKRHELLSTNGFKLEVSFHPPSVNSAFHFIAKLRIRRSANRTQPHFAKRWACKEHRTPYCTFGAPIISPKLLELES